MHVLCKTGLAAALLMLGSGAALAADTKPCSAPNQTLRPIMATHTLPPYPAMSVMTSEQGRTLVDVDIGADGVPTGAKVFQSSGSARLDDAAVEHVKNVWRWNAPIVSCQPVAVSTRVSILWDLRDAQPAAPMTPDLVMDRTDYPPGALARHEQGKVGLGVMVLANGQIGDARVLDTSGFPELDAKALEIARTRWRLTPATLDGKAINTTLVLSVSWRLDDAQK